MFGIDNLIYCLNHLKEICVFAKPNDLGFLPQSHLETNPLEFSIMDECKNPPLVDYSKKESIQLCNQTQCGIWLRHEQNSGLKSTVHYTLNS